MLALFMCAPHAAAERLVTLGGAITEIVYALGAGGDIIAADTTSQYPPEVHTLPRVGYLRALAAEPLLALAPDRIVHSADAGPPEVLAQLRAAGARLVEVPDTPTPAGVRAKILTIGEALGREAVAAQLVSQVEADVAAARRTLPADGPAPRVLFVLQIEPTTVLAAGRDTAAHAIIALAGGVNVGNDYTAYKSLGAEAVAALAPDVVVTVPRAVGAEPAPATVLGMPVFAHTPAARAGRLVVMDDLLLLGFGPRLGEAVLGLAAALQPPATR